MRRISYILLLGILLSACQKNTKSKGTNLPVEVISPIKKTETGRSREYTFLSRPYNETVLTYGPDKRSPKAAQSSRSITVTS